MTTSTWQILAGNLVVVALVVLVWSRTGYLLQRARPPLRHLLIAAIMGLGAVASMAMAVEVVPGLYLDMRVALLTVAAFFGGWPAALISGMIAAAYRLSMGGVGVFAGVVSIGLASVTGLVISLLIGKHGHKAWHVVVLASVSCLAGVIGLLMLPGDTLFAILPGVIPAMVLNLAATILAGLVYQRTWRHSAEKELLSAALTHAPDYAYVKDSRGKFAAANTATAALFGVADSSLLMGKDNFDFEDFDRAHIQLEVEHAILTSGQPLLDLEEQVTDAGGIQHWYSTTKVPLHDPSGQIIGLAGVSRDITADKQMQQELVRSRDTLSYALAEMTGGLAMFDGDGRMIFCNEQYRDAFPYTGELRQPGVLLRDVLKAVIETGEQPSAPKHVAAAAEWIEQRLANLLQESEDEIELANGRWLQIRTRPTSNGTTMVVAIDVTRFKQAEQDLHTATDQLKHLVRTDGLTGLLNRRAFDDAIEAEIRRSSRAGTPLSLLLVDVDRFKLYNDHYGHLAGDEALRKVSQTLKDSLKRPSDVVARFGGEEFTAILPDTDEDGAYLVAESFRRALAEARLPHEAIEKGYVTASVGVATYMPDVIERSALELIETADGALYSAKAAGRDRVFGTRVSDKSRLRASS